MKKLTLATWIVADVIAGAWVARKLRQLEMTADELRESVAETIDLIGDTGHMVSHLQEHTGFWGSDTSIEHLRNILGGNLETVYQHLADNTEDAEEKRYYEALIMDLRAHQDAHQEQFEEAKEQAEKGVYIDGLTPEQRKKYEAHRDAQVAAAQDSGEES